MLTADGCAQVVRKRKALKVAKMWINKALGRAWNSWIECVAEIKRLKAVANRVVKRWINRALTEALEKWHHEVMKNVCVGVFLYMYIYACICIYIHIYASIYIYTYAYIYIY